MCIYLPVLHLAVTIWIGVMYRSARVVFGCDYLDWRYVSIRSCFCGCVVFGLVLCIELLVLYFAVIIWNGAVHRAARVVFGCVNLDWRYVSNWPCCIWLCLFGLALCIDLLVLYLALIIWTCEVYWPAWVVFGRVYLYWRHLSICSCCIWLCLFGLALCVSRCSCCVWLCLFGLTLCIKLLVL